MRLRLELIKLRQKVYVPGSESDDAVAVVMSAAGYFPVNCALAGKLNLDLEVIDAVGVGALGLVGVGLGNLLGVSPPPRLGLILDLGASW